MKLRIQIALAILGLACFVLQFFLPATIDSSGVLHEPGSILTPIGLFWILCSLVLAISDIFKRK